MSQPKLPLDILRRDIDEIDAAIHDLLIQRCEVVEQIALLKGGERINIRPAREASILRQLAARHRGRFPVPILIRIWREMLAGFIQLQGPFSVAVFAVEGQRNLWDLARDHFGSTTPIVAVGAPMLALRAVIDGTATVGIVPWPEDDDADPWWRALMSADPKTPQVVARIPFVTPLRGDERAALALAQIAPEATGSDHALIGVELVEAISRSRFKDMLESSDLVPSAFWSSGWSLPKGGLMHLVEVADFISPTDQRLERLLERLGPAGQRVRVIGGFAMPIVC
jgi:chorismate mutase